MSAGLPRARADPHRRAEPSATARRETGSPGRQGAHAALCRVMFDGRSLVEAVAECCAPIDDARERSLSRELAAGVIRWLPALRHVLARLLDRPLRRRDAALEATLLMGLYQLLYTRIPAHAAVHETVRLAGAKRWHRGLANAVLRRGAVERDALLAATRDPAQPEVRFAHPGWMVDAIRADWPDDWEAVLTANCERAPMTLRVSRRVSDRPAALVRLRSAGIEASPHPIAPDALVLSEPREVDAIPGFATGEMSVQDAAAQLAVPLLDLEPGLRVLDACAAPGGKTIQILDLEPRLRALVAVDIDAGRLDRIRGNLERTGGNARLVAGDASAPETWWDGVPFERILVDAPCSGSGIVRRHPDVKLHRRPTDLDAFEVRQAALLDAAWRMLAPSGRLVYATCSLFSREGSRQAAQFLERHGDAEPIELDWGRGAGPGRQILTGEAGMDGFFHACLRKAGS